MILGTRQCGGEAAVIIETILRRAKAQDGVRFIISKTTSSGGAKYMRTPRSSDEPARRGHRSAESLEANKKEERGSAKQDSEAKSGGVRDEITTAIEKIKQMDPEMLANIARAFLKPKEATG